MLVYFVGNNSPFICQLYIDYDCPAKSNDGYEYVKFTANVFANVKYLGDEVDQTATKCQIDCDANKGGTDTETCDFFMYHYRTRRCTRLHFVRPSRVLQVGLTSDAIFCLKRGIYLYKKQNYLQLKYDKV